MPDAEKHIKSDADPDEWEGEPVGDDPLPQIRVVGYADRCESDNNWEELELGRATTLPHFCSMNNNLMSSSTYKSIPTRPGMTTFSIVLSIWPLTFEPKA